MNFINDVYHDNYHWHQCNIEYVHQPSVGLGTAVSTMTSCLRCFVLPLTAQELIQQQRFNIWQENLNERFGRAE